MVLAKNILIDFPAVRDRKGIRMRRVVSFTAEQSWQSLTNKATLTISKYIKGINQEQLREMFRIGDAVTISSGYNREHNEEFAGYITRLNDDRHLVMDLEDEMYMLKRGQLHFNKSKCKLKDLFDAINKLMLEVHGKQYTLDVADAELGNVRIKGKTPCEVLQEIKDKYKLYTYFRDGVLISGKVYQSNEVRHVLNFDNERNIKGHSLEFNKAEDLKVRVKVTSVTSSGQLLTATAGDEDGAESEIGLYGINNQADLQKKADAKLALMKVDGYKGDINCYAVPFIRFGDEVQLRSAKFPERDGAYYVDATNLKYETGNGIERTVTIAKRAS